jgi:transcriptional regulator with XRE-family HTH domain
MGSPPERAIDPSSPNMVNTASRVDPHNPASDMSTAHSGDHSGNGALRHVAKRVRAARIARGMSLEGLGQLVGIKLQQISRYETAQCNLSTPRLAAIAKALDIPLSYFFEDFGSTDEIQLAESHRGSGRLTLLSAYNKLNQERRMLLLSIAKSLAEVPSEQREEAALDKGTPSPAES